MSQNRKQDIPEIIEALTGEHIEVARALFKEYAASIGVDLCFQGFEAELKGLPGRYAPPGGGLFVAYAGNEPVGCVALRPLEETGVAELKRLFVRPSGRGMGLGKTLAERAISRAREGQYTRIRLDTLATMQDAQRLYRRLGFKEIAPYTFNPSPDAVYMELDLTVA
jgi:ribosomal protein S18 acetylase RimI-like enzyme